FLIASTSGKFGKVWLRGRRREKNWNKILFDSSILKNRNKQSFVVVKNGKFMK
ncbi:hypothetical protein S83_047408, partial [Arachis hypogaea]